MVQHMTVTLTTDEQFTYLDVGDIGYNVVDNVLIIYENAENILDAKTKLVVPIKYVKYIAFD